MYLSIVYSKRRILPSSNVCRPALPHPPDPTLRWNPPLIFRHSHRHPWHSGIYWTHHSHPTVLASEPLLVVFCAKQTFVNFCSCTFVEQFLQTDNTSTSTCTSSSTIFMPIPQNTQPSRTVPPPLVSSLAWWVSLSTVCRTSRECWQHFYHSTATIIVIVNV